jgi:hypothetical protein
MPIATAAARDAAAAAVFESASLGIGLAPTAEPPACAVASPIITASKTIAMNPLGLIGMVGGVADGTRTHDNRNHNPGLYQLSYGHRKRRCEL